MLCAWQIGVISECDCEEIEIVKMVCKWVQSVSESGCKREGVWPIRWEEKMNKIKKQIKKIKNEEQNSRIKENARN